MSADLINTLRAARCCVKDGSAVAQQIDAALAQAEAPAVAVTKDMVYAFHRAITDGDLNKEGFAEIKAGLTAALCNAQPAAPKVPMSDSEVIARCEQAGIRWIHPDPDAEDGGFPGGFDMTGIGEMRRLIAAAGASQ